MIKEKNSSIITSLWFWWLVADGWISLEHPQLIGSQKKRGEELEETDHLFPAAIFHELLLVTSFSRPLSTSSFWHPSTRHEVEENRTMESFLLESHGISLWKAWYSFPLSLTWNWSPWPLQPLSRWFRWWNCFVTNLMGFYENGFRFDPTWHRWWGGGSDWSMCIWPWQVLKHCLLH